jgi:hypothetical protein
MLCDGVCMRNMHRLLDGVYFFVFGILRVGSDRLVVLTSYWWM